ncbi:MAG TPA: SPOR domain-containing protein [Candidatus Hydrogenedentes bacterium]|jgi:cell division septation protein DedD|nr:MAG: Sporulation related domain protein [Candidatus Hydrogenedentes bacterium ADurb.Bin170]HNZ49197.1 SPOR domain-containing protein [Candidatus Hydrogenedentota bacterium]HOD96464.1 SPOR domain-containing protein [Candidatus Hydrogenedentota bacterium]HOH42942.1 SPOR domain-containing protein [Candidatus Hydrogenedentota bacterium]HOM48976.1 SPOR domain-containing protein [Candidatus Hydrogenedentota bacterium]
MKDIKIPKLSIPLVKRANGKRLTAQFPAGFIILVLIAVFSKGCFLDFKSSDKESEKKETAAAPVPVEKETYAIPLSQVQNPPASVPAPDQAQNPVNTPATTEVPPAVAEAPAPSAAEQPVATEVAQRTAETMTPRSPFSDNKPILTTLPPLPVPRRNEMQVAAPSRQVPPETQPAAASAAAAPAPAPAPAAAPAPAPAAAAAAVPELTPVDPVEPLITVAQPAPQPAPAPKAAPAPQKEAAPAKAPSGRGKFGVQLGAFSGAERQAKAQALQRKVKEKAGMTAEIDISSNKEIYKVIVVGFPDKEAATKALPGLKQKLGISEGFVKAL